MPLTLSGTNGVSGVDGSAGTPAVRGGDANTGIVYGTDTVSIVTGGTERVQVNSSGQTLVPDGSASAPAITNSGDENTGIFFPAADTIAFAEGGVESARLTSAGVLQVGNNSGTGEVFAQNTVKVWGVINSSTTAFLNSFGASSVSKTSTGIFQVNFSRTLASSRFGMSGATYASAAFIAGGNESTTGTQIRTYNNSGTLIDTDSMFMVVGGS